MAPFSLQGCGATCTRSSCTAIPQATTPLHATLQNVLWLATAHTHLLCMYMICLLHCRPQAHCGQDAAQPVAGGLHSDAAATCLHRTCSTAPHGCGTQLLCTALWLQVGSNQLHTVMWRDTSCQSVSSLRMLRSVHLQPCRSSHKHSPNQ
jgi:hypothetical protein